MSGTPLIENRLPRIVLDSRPRPLFRPASGVVPHSGNAASERCTATLEPRNAVESCTRL